MLYLRGTDAFFGEREMKLYKAAAPIPELRRGSVVRVYGKRGFPVRGLDVDGREVFYSPPEETLEGWWADVLARPGREGQVLYAYEPRSWRALLPGAPKRIWVTRRDLVVATSAGEEAFPLYDYLWAEPEYSSWANIGAAVVLVSLLNLVLFQAHSTVAGALALLCVQLAGIVLSRSEDLYVSSGLDCTGGNRKRRYPILGRDPALRDLLAAAHKYMQPSRKRYWRELLPSPADPGNPW